MDLAKRLSEKREEILRACAKHGVSNVRIVGSVARGQSGPNSDVDVLVRFEREFRGFDYVTVLDQLQEQLESILDVDVDVVDEAVLKGRMRERVLSEAVAL